jgi:hypothetical protein
VVAWLQLRPQLLPQLLLLLLSYLRLNGAGRFRCMTELAAVPYFLLLLLLLLELPSLG